MFLCRWRITNNRSLDELLNSMRNTTDAMDYIIPFERHIQKPFFQLISLALGLYLISFAAMLGIEYDSYGTFQAKQFEMNIFVDGMPYTGSNGSADESINISFYRFGCKISTRPNVSFTGQPE